MKAILVEDSLIALPIIVCTRFTYSKTLKALVLKFRINALSVLEQVKQVLFSQALVCNVCPHDFGNAKANPYPLSSCTPLLSTHYQGEECASSYLLIGIFCSAPLLEVHISISCKLYCQDILQFVQLPYSFLLPALQFYSVQAFSFQYAKHVIQTLESL